MDNLSNKPLYNSNRPVCLYFFRKFPSCMLILNSYLFGTLEYFYSKLTSAQTAAKFVHPKQYYEHLKRPAQTRYLGRKHMGWFLADMFAHKVIFRTKGLILIYIISLNLKCISSKKFERQICHLTGYQTQFPVAEHKPSIYGTWNIHMYSFG